MFLLRFLLRLIYGIKHQSCKYCYATLNDKMIYMRKEGKKKYRSFDSHREKKRERTTLSAHARERAHESREERREKRFPCLSFVSSPSATLNRFL